MNILKISKLYIKRVTFVVYSYISIKIKNSLLKGAIVRINEIINEKGSNVPLKQ